MIEFLLFYPSKISEDKWKWCLSFRVRVLILLRTLCYTFVYQLHMTKPA